jgi:hypothetical protein
LHKLGLSTAQFAVLTTLQELNAASGAELGRRRFVTPQTVTRVIAGLVKAMILRSATDHKRAPPGTFWDKERRQSNAIGLDQGLRRNHPIFVPTPSTPLMTKSGPSIISINRFQLPRDPKSTETGDGVSGRQIHQADHPPAAIARDSAAC